MIIAHLDDPNVVEVVANAPCEVQGYGENKDLAWSLANVRANGGSTGFTVNHNGEKWADFTVKLPGRHNCLNALAVTAVLHRIGVVPETINEGLQHFGGIKRRQEVRGRVNNVTVIDDFAHHPTAVKETIQALKNGYAGQRLITVFEPRTNSSRRAIFQQDYIPCFDASDLTFIREPVPLETVAKEDLFSAKQLATDINKRGKHALSCPDTESILTELQQVLTAQDVVAILSNGGFDNIHTRLLEQLQTGKSA